MEKRRVFTSVVLFLVTAGWSANHFASVLVVLRERLHLSPLLVNSAYGIYALGLLPSLLVGGAVADRVGARPVVMTGSLLAAFGNLLLLLFHGPAGLLSGRFVVGLGVGLVVSAGTAWAARLGGANGATLAGIVLTSGFTLGPFFSGVVAATFAPVWVPFALTITLSLCAAAYALRAGDVPRVIPPAPAPGGTAGAGGASATKALATAVPVAVWVFASITTPMVGLSARVAEYFSTGVFLPGVAAVLGFGTGLVVQALGRRFTWGPRAGVAGASLAAAGMALAGLGGATPPLPLFFAATLLLGAAYGLCLRDGLLDVNTYAPPAYRGRVMGMYYVATYVGFGLPPLLQWVEPRVGPSLPFFVLAGLALVSAAVRAAQIRSTYLNRA